jgi:hypothetical protein
MTHLCAALTFNLSLQSIWPSNHELSPQTLHAHQLLHRHACAVPATTPAAAQRGQNCCPMPAAAPHRPRVELPPMCLPAQAQGRLETRAAVRTIWIRGRAVHGTRPCKHVNWPGPRPHGPARARQSIWVRPAAVPPRPSELMFPGTVLNDDSSKAMQVAHHVDKSACQSNQLSSIWTENLAA